MIKYAASVATVGTRGKWARLKGVGSFAIQIRGDLLRVRVLQTLLPRRPVAHHRACVQGGEHERRCGNGTFGAIRLLRVPKVLVLFSKGRYVRQRHDRVQT
jgi:hypothetical protein